MEKALEFVDNSLKLLVLEDIGQPLGVSISIFICWFKMLVDSCILL